MKYLTKQGLMRAFDLGIDAFLKALNKELETANGPVQSDLLIAPPRSEAQGQVLRELIAFYVAKYKEKNGPKARPDVGGKAQGVLLRLLKSYNAGQVRRLIEVYLKLDDKRFEDAYHSLVVLEAHLQRVLYSATTGQRSRELTGVEEAALKHAQEEKVKIGNGG